MKMIFDCVSLGSYFSRELMDKIKPIEFYSAPRPKEMKVVSEDYIEQFLKKETGRDENGRQKNVSNSRQTGKTVGDALSKWKKNKKVRELKAVDIFPAKKKSE